MQDYNISACSFFFDIGLFPFLDTCFFPDLRGMLQPIVHYGLHFAVPVWIAWQFFKPRWIRAMAILWLTMLIDLDHLLATPLFDACRCSINYHPLHTYWAMGVYVVLLFFKRTRLVGIGLLLHLLADAIDCWFSNFNCP